MPVGGGGARGASAYGISPTTIAQMLIQGSKPKIRERLNAAMNLGR